MNSFGKNIRITIFGESHNESIGLVIDGLPPKLTIDEEEIRKSLKKRQGNSPFSTPRQEKNEFKIISGYFNNQTTGLPLTIIIFNKDTDSSSYHLGEIRPSHADLPIFLKYQGANDYRGGGASSGRMTAVLVILGVICKQILKSYNIKVISRIKSVADIVDEIDPSSICLDTLLNIKDDSFPVLDEATKKLMLNKINKAKENNDSLGGTIETYIFGVKPGIGEPFFDSLESIISHLMFSIPGVKGILFGDGLLLSKNTGRQILDEISYQNNDLKFASNHQGGINGGISNGNIINFTSVIRAPSSINQEVNSINIVDNKNILLRTSGRHDVTFIDRIIPVINSLSYYAILEMVKEYEKYN